MEGKHVLRYRKLGRKTKGGTTSSNQQTAIKPKPCRVPKNFKSSFEDTALLQLGSITDILTQRVACWEYFRVKNGTSLGLLGWRSFVPFTTSIELLHLRFRNFAMGFFSSLLVLLISNLNELSICNKLCLNNALLKEG